MLEVENDKVESKNKVHGHINDNVKCLLLIRNVKVIPLPTSKTTAHFHGSVVYFCYFQQIWGKEPV